MSEMEESKHGEESPAEPAYDISDVRAALRTLLEDVKQQQSQEQPNADAEAIDAAYCGVLTTLHKICTNLLKSPVNPAHLSLNLRNAAVVKKFGGFRGARDLLKFCGFQETEDAATHTLAVPAAELELLRVKIDRAAVIVLRVKAEHSPPEPVVAEPAGPASTVVSPSGEAMTDIAAPSSVFLANADDEIKDFHDFGDDASSSPISDESMKPDLEPTYNIADVRNALKKLFSEVEATLPTPTEKVTPLQVRMHALTIRDAYVQVLDTLIKITQNVLKSPVNPQHLRINLSNAAVQKKFAQFEGAVDYLRFLGFAEDATVTSPNAAAGGDPQQLLVLSESVLTSEAVKLNRALTIINQQRAAHVITAEENEQRNMSAIAREIRVFDVNQADPSRLANPTLGGVDEYVEEGRNDMGLVLQANLAERKRVHEMSRTDVIITKAKQQELKDAMKRKYHRTLIKITFTDKIVGGREQQQGSGRFGNTNRRAGGYVLGSKNDTASSTAAAAAAASGPVPMEVDPLTHLSNAAIADAGTPVSPNAASTPSVTSPTAPTAPPAPELLVCAYFRPWETLGDLFSFMQRELLVHGASTDSFYLHLPPNLRLQCGGDDKGGKNKALEEKTLQSLGLVPAAALMFHYSAGSSASDVPGAVVDSLKEEIRVSKEPYDAPLVATLVPQAENKAELEALKQKMLTETRERERILNGEGVGGSSSSAAASSSSMADDADGDIEAYMRKKKAAAARSSSSMPKTGGNSLGGSSSGAGSAASKRNIAGLFKPK